MGRRMLEWRAILHDFSPQNSANCVNHSLVHSDPRGLLRPAFANTRRILARSSGHPDSHSCLRATYSRAWCRVNLKMWVHQLEITMLLTLARDGLTASCGSWPKTSGKVAQEGRLVRNFQAVDFGTAAPDFQDHFDDVVNVALRVDATRDCQAHQVHRGVLAEHERPDFH